jgi:CRP/FNR family transcriptional regulator, cyclic AMP receptor protein
MEKKQAIDKARRVGWLAQTPPQFQDRLLRQCDLVGLSPSQSVYGEGDGASGLFFVAEGLIGFHMHAPDGAPTLGQVAGVGFWAGDLAAATGRPRKLGISTRTHTWLLRLSRPSLNSIASEDEAAFWRHISTLLGINYAVTLDIISALRRDRPGERLAATILNLMHGFPENPSLLPINQSDLGAIARLSRASVNGCVQELERRGWIKLGYSSIEILDESGLRSFSHGE